MKGDPYYGGEHSIFLSYTYTSTDTSWLLIERQDEPVWVFRF